MDLRALKKEVHSLPNIKQTLNELQNNWLKPIRSNTNSHLPFLNDLSQNTKKELNKKLAQYHESASVVNYGQTIQDKLQHYARYLIELKLTELQGDSSKSRLITNNFLNDDFLNIKQTIIEVKSFEKEVQKLSNHYQEINEMLHKELSLEQTLFLMDLPHKIYLHNLLKAAQQQKKIVRQIGRHFVTLAKKTQLDKK